MLERVGVVLRFFFACFLAAVDLAAAVDFGRVGLGEDFVTRGEQLGR